MKQTKLNKLSFLTNRKISITFRLTAIYATILSLMIFVLSFVNFKVVQHLSVETTKDDLTRSSESIARYLASGGEPDKSLTENADINPDIQIRIINDGKVLFQKNSNMDISDYRRNLDEHQVLNKGFSYILLNKKVIIGAKEVYIQLALDMKRSSDLMKVMYDSLLMVNLLGIVISVLSGIYLTKKVLKPIEAIAQTAESISINDLSQRIEIDGPNDELKELARTFNSMIDRLQDAIERQKQFVSDASHELRTPISVIQGYSRMLERWGKRDEAVLDEAIVAIKAETENMRRLFEQLLTLAQADSGQLLMEKELFRLDHLLDDVIRDFSIIAPQHRFELIGNHPLEITADRGMVLQLLRILLDNGSKYTPAPGTIRLSMEVVDAWCVIRVSDNGVGIPESDQPYIFNRFYRSEKSRSKQKGGTGLGLSIAGWIVESHGGTIGIESKPGEGTTMVVTLPLREPELQELMEPFH